MASRAIRYVRSSRKPCSTSWMTGRHVAISSKSTAVSIGSPFLPEDLDPYRRIDEDHRFRARGASSRIAASSPSQSPDPARSRIRRAFARRTKSRSAMFTVPEYVFPPESLVASLRSSSSSTRFVRFMCKVCSRVRLEVKAVSRQPRPSRLSCRDGLSHQRGAFCRRAEAFGLMDTSARPAPSRQLATKLLAFCASAESPTIAVTRSSLSTRLKSCPPNCPTPRAGIQSPHG